MKTSLKKILTLFFVLIMAMGMTISAGADEIQNLGLNGTTLSAYKTADGHIERTYHWTIEKSVAPSTLNLFRGDSGSSKYKITVTRDDGTDDATVDGEICITNGGAVATEGLTIWDDIMYKTGAGPIQVLESFQISTDALPDLAAGESHCYPYEHEFTPVAGAQYKNTVNITITNHSGYLGEPFGPSPSDDFSLPSSPDVINYGTINVDDTNGGSWSFTDDGSVSYDKTFSCDTDGGEHGNTATIRETGQSDDANVQVNCFALTVTKDAHTTYSRTYIWDPGKTSSVPSLILSTGQTIPVNYSVTADVSGFDDSDWAVNGTITISNPAPMDATLSSVTDLISPDIAADVDCPSLVVPAEDTLVCTYSANLPDAQERTNTATATLDDGTSFSGTANVVFGPEDSTNEFDTCAFVTDS